MSSVISSPQAKAPGLGLRPWKLGPGAVQPERRSVAVCHDGDGWVGVRRPRDERAATGPGDGVHGGGDVVYLDVQAPPPSVAGCLDDRCDRPAGDRCAQLLSVLGDLSQPRTAW